MALSTWRLGITSGSAGYGQRSGFYSLWVKDVVWCCFSLGRILLLKIVLAEVSGDGRLLKRSCGRCDSDR